MPTPTHKLNDIVVPNPESGWGRNVPMARHIIVKVPTRSNEVNYVAKPVDADGNQIPGAHGLKAQGFAFLPADQVDITVAAVPGAFSNPPVASLVRPTSGSGIPTGLYVVTGETDAQRVRIMRLGGDKGRDWRANGRSLEVLEPSQVEAALSAL